MLNLLPLPVPGTSEWPYDLWLPQRADLSSRASYERVWSSSREEALRKLMKDGCPKVVVFVGWKERAAWERIAKKMLVPLNEYGFCVKRGSPTFVLAYHPRARKTDWIKLGSALGGR